MTGNKNAKPSRIPAFASREEEAEFWDTHSTADYEDEFKPVKVRVAKNLSHGMTIRLDPDTLREVRELAQEKGMGPTTLIRMWVMERLQEVKSARR
jgi:predicted DNA binding CopG/RHH family protein